MKKVLISLLYLLGFVVLLYFSFLIYGRYEEIKNTEFKVYPGLFYFTLTFLPLGLYFGLPQLLKTIKTKGKIKVNKTKLLVFGLPTLYFTLYPWLYYHSTFLVIHNLRWNEFLVSPGLLVFPSFFFGYVIISSFQKEFQS